jgi:hypothetical protein
MDTASPLPIGVPIRERVKQGESSLAETYDVTIVTVRPGTHPAALAVLEKSLASEPSLLACWYCDIGALNRILIIRKSAEAAVTIEHRFAALNARSPFGIGEFIAMAQSGAGPRAGITFAGGNGRGDRHGDSFHAYLAVPEL